MVPRQQPPPTPPRPAITQRAISTNSAKLSYRSFQSYRSHSSSFEADDERSTSSDNHSMGEGDGFRDAAAQYHGEDTRLTSRKELLGWYTYAFAAEVFVICGIGSFIPMTLEQLARENGYLATDPTRRCPSSSDRDLLPPGLGPGTSKATQCVVYFLGMQINTASFAMYTFSLSVLVQSILVISISCAADHGNYRKRLLLTFGWVGSIATMLFLAVTARLYLLASLLAIISNTCFGASFVLLNSFLPLLVRHHPKAQYQTPQFTPQLEPSEIDDQSVEESLVTGEATPANEGTPLLSSAVEAAVVPLAKNTTSIELQLSTRISSTGVGIGYSAGLILQCVLIVIVYLMDSTTFSLLFVIFMVGLWWFSFTIPAAIWLRPRPGPPLPSDDPDNPEAERSWLSYIIYAWKSLYRTVKLARRLKDICLFLAAWFLLSDAIATVSGVAVLYAKTTLHMEPAALGLINVITVTAGVLGAFSWSLISRLLGLRPHQTILACICLFELIPLYGLLGFLPIVKRLGFLGLQQRWEMYPLGFVYGFVLGGLGSYCRSLFGELIPPGSEAAFFALYAITDKGSSIFGPAIVGMIVDRYGEIRPAFWFLAFLVGIPGPLIYFVDVERGRREGAKLAEVIEGFREEGESEVQSLIANGVEREWEERTL